MAEAVGGKGLVFLPRAMRIGSAALIFAIALGPTLAHAAWGKGEFESGGKPVAEFHCAPTGAGPFPVVVLLHGAAARGAGDNDFEDWCTTLANHGY
jgi:poly(3-hydroxybutyrate) depolymerase